MDDASLVAGMTAVVHLLLGWTIVVLISGGAAAAVGLHTICLGGHWAPPPVCSAAAAVDNCWLAVIIMSLLANYSASYLLVVRDAWYCALVVRSRSTTSQPRSTPSGGVVRGGG